MKKNYQLVNLALVVLAAVVVSAVGTGEVSAQEPKSFVERPVRVVIPYAPGGATDVVARKLGEKMGGITGQPVVVENKPGGASVIAVRQLLSSAPDGHTLALFDSASSTLTPFLFKKESYDRNELVPVTMVARIPFAVLTSPDFPANNLAEFVEYVKKNPGLPFASSGMGNSVHIGMERFLALAGLKMTHVPYRGAAPALQDLAAGQITAAMMDISSAMELVKGGKLKVLAVTSAERSELLPNVPTVGESGYDGFQAGNWFAYFVRSGTSAPALESLNSTLRAVINTPEISGWLKSIALEPYTTGTDEVARFVEADAEINRDVIRQLGLTLD